MMISVVGEKGKTMLKFVLFVMIGNKLKMDEWYWTVLCIYAVIWTVGKIMGWLQ
jgi:hypothetical protein